MFQWAKLSGKRSVCQPKGASPLFSQLCNSAWKYIIVKLPWDSFSKKILTRWPTKILQLEKLKMDYTSQFIWIGHFWKKIQIILKLRCSYWNLWRILHYTQPWFILSFSMYQFWDSNFAGTYLQLSLRQWGAGNVYLLVLSSWKVNIAEKHHCCNGVVDSFRH